MFYIRELIKPRLFYIIVIFFLSASIVVLYNKLNTYESALDNTMTATTMKIEEIKSEKRAREQAYNQAQLQSDAKINNLCKDYGDYIPHTYIVDGTCTINKNENDM